MPLQLADTPMACDQLERDMPAATRTTQTGPSRGGLLSLRSLTVNFQTNRGEVRAVRGFDLDINPGEIVALVGESGSGKSTIGHALIRLLQHGPGVRVSGTAQYRLKDGQTVDVLALPERAMRRVRGNDIAMIFQEPMSSLNPIFTVGAQIAEVIRLHRQLGKRDAQEDALAMLARLGLPNPRKCLDSYPHQLSGGMRQRVMIAMALSCQPSLLIADEPTTALDVTVQAQIVDLLQQEQARSGMAVLFVTHDLGLVSEIADRAVVLYAGQAVETAPVRNLFTAPRMPYTRALLHSMPRLGAAAQDGYVLCPIPGQPANTLGIGDGCAFLPRCAFARPEACARPQSLDPAEPDHMVRCCRRDALGTES